MVRRDLTSVESTTELLATGSFPEEILATVPHSKSAPDLSAFCTVQANKWRRHSFDNDSESNADATSSDGKVSTDGSNDEENFPENSVNALRQSIPLSCEDGATCPSTAATRSLQGEPGCQSDDLSNLATGTSTQNGVASYASTGDCLAGPHPQVSGNGSVAQSSAPNRRPNVCASQVPRFVGELSAACPQTPSRVSNEMPVTQICRSAPINANNIFPTPLHDLGTDTSKSEGSWDSKRSSSSESVGLVQRVVSPLHSPVGVAESSNLLLPPIRVAYEQQMTTKTGLVPQRQESALSSPKLLPSRLGISPPISAPNLGCPALAHVDRGHSSERQDLSRRKLMLRLGLARPDRTMRPFPLTRDCPQKATSPEGESTFGVSRAKGGNQRAGHFVGDIQPPSDFMDSNLNFRKGTEFSDQSSTPFGTPTRLHQPIPDDRTLSATSVQHPTAAAGKFRLSSIHLKGREDFRVNYLRRLSYANVWIPQAQRPPRHQTISIFDWDDTLLCTSYINLRGSQFGTAAIAKQLAAIEQHAKVLLATALKLGRVFVITNAMDGWVQYSAKQYLPGLLRTLQHVTVISARHRYECSFPGDYQRWKIQAFLEVQKSLNSEVITNLLSVGDSTIEMDAVHVMGQGFSLALIKTIKFRENPSPDELAKQLELVSQKFEKICLSARNLKIGLERRVMQPKQRRHDRPHRGGVDSQQERQPTVSSSAMGLVDETKLSHG